MPRALVGTVLSLVARVQGNSDGLKALRIAAQCEQTPDCVGFTHYGFMLNQWVVSEVRALPYADISSLVIRHAQRSFCLAIQPFLLSGQSVKRPKGAW